MDKYPPEGDSHYGCVDMAGNVWEWMQSQYKRTSMIRPMAKRTWKQRMMSSVWCGAFGDGQGSVRCAVRVRYVPDSRYDDVGFRVVVFPISTTSVSDPLYLGALEICTQEWDS